MEVHVEELLKIISLWLKWVKQTFGRQGFAIVLFSVGICIFYQLARSNGRTTGQWTIGTIIYTAVLITVVLKAALITE